MPPKKAPLREAEVYVRVRPLAADGGHAEDGTVLAVGSPGADRITTAILQTLIGHIRIGLPLSEAIEHPRLHVAIGESGPTAMYEVGLPVGKVDLPRRQMPAGSMITPRTRSRRWRPRLR